MCVVLIILTTVVVYNIYTHFNLRRHLCLFWGFFHPWRIWTDVTSARLQLSNKLADLICAWISVCLVFLLSRPLMCFEVSPIDCVEPPADDWHFDRARLRLADWPWDRRDSFMFTCLICFVFQRSCFYFLFFKWLWIMTMEQQDTGSTLMMVGWCDAIIHFKKAFGT